MSEILHENKNSKNLNSLSGEMLKNFTTEQFNDASKDIDTKNSLEIVTIINNEDKKVPLAVQKILPEISALVDDITYAFKSGGRLFYIGAGTSGRLGVLDASECPPTYGVEQGMVIGLIAGGKDALTNSIENAEDKAFEGIQSLIDHNFNSRDVLVGISASGQAPYVVGSLEYAKNLGAVTAAISCNAGSITFDYAKHKLYADVGAEVISGSTRMKSGTAQKLILNMLTTASMIRIGKVYKNLMVDLKPVNHKLVLRSLRLIMEVSGCSNEVAKKALEESGMKVKTAIVMVLLGSGKEEAQEQLEKAGGHIGRIKT